MVPTAAASHTTSSHGLPLGPADDGEPEVLQGQRMIFRVILPNQHK
jgi:hypothetical protein